MARLYWQLLMYFIKAVAEGNNAGGEKGGEEQIIGLSNDDACGGHADMQYGRDESHPYKNLFVCV